VFPFLALLAWGTGSAVVGNKVAAALFAGLTAAGGVVAGKRWTGSLLAGAVCGVWWACSSLHLSVSSEFLKNSGGLAVLAWLLASLPGCTGRRWVVPIALGLFGLLVHKLTGALGVAAVLATVAVRVVQGRVPPKWILGVLAVGTVGVLAVGAWQAGDLARLTTESGGGRWARLMGPRLGGFEQVELGVVHLAPLAALALWASDSLGDLRLPVLGLAVVAVAPGLPFSFDGTAWRLLLTGFVPVGLLLAAAVRWKPWLAVAPLGGAVALGALSVPAQQGRSPDYVALEPALVVLQQHVPQGDRVVAHRGLCGFIQAQAERPCENFQPQGDPEGWWRVAYGFSPERLAPYGPVVALREPYVLLSEADWQDFVAAEDWAMTRDPRNPYQARPGYVLGPSDTEPR
jgi:hypothetical protein